jgi:hypothetical protein
MRFFLRSLLACSLLGFCLVCAGCSSGNEGEANISGEAPAAPVDYSSQNQPETKSLAEQGYPGAK